MTAVRKSWLGNACLSLLLTGAVVGCAADSGKGDKDCTGSDCGANEADDSDLLQQSQDSHDEEVDAGSEPTHDPNQPWNAASCPDSTPTEGSSCDEGEKCAYQPNDFCFCTAGSWRCRHTLFEPNAPSNIATDVVVAELSDEDASAWCTWYKDSFPLTDGEPPPYDPNTAFAELGAWVGGADELCVQHLAVEACVANLRLGACTATLGQLEQCVTTQFSGSAGDGCDPFRAASSCDTTIVQPPDRQPSTGCHVPLR